MAKRAAKPPERPASPKNPYTDGSGAWPVPNYNAGLTFKNMGSSGLRQFGGWVREEYLPQLVGRQGARTYREMSDGSSIVGAILFAIQQSIRKVEWRVEPAHEPDQEPTAEAEEYADFADSLRDDMSHTWEDFVAEALSMISYGFAPHEIVLKRRMGPTPPGPSDPRDPNYVQPSKHDDGRIGVASLPIRGQDTIIKWFFSVNGSILGLTQQPWVGSLIDIPIEKLLLFRPTAHKNNPEGRSVLRNSYRPWFFQKRLEEQEAIFLERMSGVPVIYIPNDILEAASAANAPATATAALAQWQKMVTNLRVDEQMGLLLPSNRWNGNNGPTAERMFEFKLEVPMGRAQGQFHIAIERYKLDILYTVLADFIQLGHSARGTQTLGISKIDMFFQAIEGWLNSVAAVLNDRLLPLIWKLNALPLELMPKFVPDLAQRIDLDSLGNYFLHISQAGAALFPDEDLEDWLRNAAGAPEQSEEAMQAAEDDAAQSAAAAQARTEAIANPKPVITPAMQKILRARMKARPKRRAKPPGAY